MSFAHAIVRETLYAELSTAQRVQLHKRVGEAIEDIEGDGAGDRLLDDLARHFIEAAPAGELHKAVDYARRAAHAASCQLAHDDAATLYARALELVDGQPGADAPTRMEIAYQLGRARWLAGRFAEARAAYEQVADLARELGDSERLADAALGISLVAVAGAGRRAADGAAARGARGDRRPRRGDRDPATKRDRRANGLARPRRGPAAGRSTLDAARRLGDDHALAVALFAQQFMLAATPESPRDRLGERRRADPGRRPLRRPGLRGPRPRLSRCTLSSSWATSPPPTPPSPTTRDWPTSCASRRTSGTCRWSARCGRRWTGRFDDAEQLAEEARRGGERAQEPLSGQFHALQIAVIRRLQGRLEEALPAVREMAKRFPAIRAWRLTPRRVSWPSSAASTRRARSSSSSRRASSTTWPATCSGCLR